MKNLQKDMYIRFNAGIITQGVVGSMIKGHIQIARPRKPLYDPSNNLQGMSVNQEIIGKRLQDITMQLQMCTVPQDQLCILIGDYDQILYY